MTDTDPNNYASSELRSWVADMRRLEGGAFREAVEAAELCMTAAIGGGGGKTLNISVDDKEVKEVDLDDDNDALIEYANGASYRGSLRNGAADGEGVFDDGRGGLYHGEFLAGRLNGWITTSNSEFELAEAYYHLGQRTAEGSRRRLRRNCPRSLLEVKLGSKTSWTEREGGGFFVDTRSPKATVFLYPGLKFAITGTFDRGVKRHLIRGRAAVLVGVEWQPSSGGGIPVPIVRPVNDGCCPHTLAYECPTSHSIASVAPTRKDYYEMQTCRVATSSLGAAAGEGLFAARDINNGELIALFNGVRTRKLYRTVPCDAETDDNWSDYSITLNKEMSLDIPNDSINLSNYSATSAHKACHSFSPNAKFARLFHPRFGNIMSVVASEDLKMGEEVLVHYRYQIASSPLWYRALWKSFLRKQGWSDYTAERYGYSAHEVGQYFKSINDRITKEADI